MNKNFNPLSLLFLLIICFIGFISIFQLILDEREIDLYKNILLSDVKFSEVLDSSNTAERYYQLAGTAYEKNEYFLVENNCKLARDYYAKASQGYLEIASDLKPLNSDILIENYIERLNLLSDINTNLYEACEHFEAAARYYNKYYNTNVPSTDISFDMGGQEIDLMNEKIILHDENVAKYNELLADYKSELERKLR